MSQIMATCGCGKRYPAAQGCSDGRQIVCPGCASAHATRLNVRAAQINLQAARRAMPRRRGLFG